MAAFTAATAAAGAVARISALPWMPLLRRTTVAVPAIRITRGRWLPPLGRGLPLLLFEEPLIHPCPGGPGTRNLLSGGIDLPPLWQSAVVPRGMP